MLTSVTVARRVTTKVTRRSVAPRPAVNGTSTEGERRSKEKETVVTRKVNVQQV